MKTFLKSAVILSMPFILATTGCKKLQDSINFGFNIKGEFTMPPNPVPNVPVNLPAIPVSYNANEEFSSNGTSADLVKDIRISYLKLTVTEPAGGNFDFLKSIKIYMSKDSMADKLVAWKDPVPEPSDSVLSLDVTSDNLDAFLKSGDFKLKISAECDKVTNTSQKISYDIRTSVKANVFK